MLRPVSILLRSATDIIVHELEALRLPCIELTLQQQKSQVKGLSVMKIPEAQKPL